LKFIKCYPSELTLEKYHECYDNKTHILVQDDYKLWNNNKRSKEFGEIIKGYSGVIQYGFDDNDCMYPNGENIKVFKINTVRAALEEDYFINILGK